MERREFLAGVGGLIAAASVPAALTVASAGENDPWGKRWCGLDELRSVMLLENHNGTWTVKPFPGHEIQYRVTFPADCVQPFVDSWREKQTTHTHLFKCSDFHVDPKDIENYLYKDAWFLMADRRLPK